MEYRSWLKQAWTIARIEMRRAFFSKRAFWVYGLALLPAVIFFAYAVQMKIRRTMLSTGNTVKPALLDSVRDGEDAEAVIQRLGKPSSDFQWQRQIPARGRKEATGITSHQIEPPFEARYIRLNVLAGTRTGDLTARIYEFEVYGEDGTTNLALRRPATSSTPCSADEGPEKALNGSSSGGMKDRWCSREPNRFLQVDLGAVHKVKRIVVKHASAGGEPEIFDTALFNIQASQDNQYFAMIVDTAGSRLMMEISVRRTVTYFDGRREVNLVFEKDKLVSRNIHTLSNFDEDRSKFAGIFQLNLRLSIFFGCLGIFMNLFRGEMLDKTLHFWFLAPARREVLLVGKYGAGLIASIVIFVGGTLLCFGIMLLMHNSSEVQAYWHAAGWAHAFWYAITAALGCVGYGSVFLAAGLVLRNPIIPAAVLLGWEAINGFLPTILQKLSVLYYLQSLCPVPAPTDKNMPALLQMLLNPADPVSHTGAIIGILGVAALVLWIACVAIRRMEVSYSAEA
jgi:ABC-type transport system involved in multi-copper enzyme maturation permease subunit